MRGSILTTMGEILAARIAGGRKIDVVTPNMVRDNQPGICAKRQFGKAPKKKRGK